MGPKEIQFLFPFTVRPKGMSRNIIIKAISSPRRAIHLTVDSGNLETNRAMGIEPKLMMICLELIAKEEPLSVKPVTCAAEKTMTFPKNSTPSEVITNV